jgi:hypothetical protein
MYSEQYLAFDSFAPQPYRIAERQLAALERRQALAVAHAVNQAADSQELTGHRKADGDRRYDQPDR